MLYCQFLLSVKFFLHFPCKFLCRVANFGVNFLSSKLSKLQNLLANHEEDFLNFSKFTLLFLLALSKEELLPFSH